LNKLYLQRNRGAAKECGCHILIEIDHDVLVYSDLCISELDPLMNPVLEVIPNHSIDQVHKILLGKLLNLFDNREIAQHRLVIKDLIHDEFDRQCLVLWNIEMLDIIALKVLKKKKMIRNVKNLSYIQPQLTLFFPPTRSFMW
jgi:hypothetical protein